MDSPSTHSKTKDAIPFSGYPRQHPSEKNKILLVFDPLGISPTVLEFKLEDVLYIEEIPSAITEAGEGIPMLRLWIRRGAHGVVLEPFEVNNPLNFSKMTNEIHKRFIEPSIPASKTSRRENTAN